MIQSRVPFRGKKKDPGFESPSGWCAVGKVLGLNRDKSAEGQLRKSTRQTLNLRGRHQNCDSCVFKAAVELPLLQQPFGPPCHAKAS